MEFYAINISLFYRLGSFLHKRQWLSLFVLSSGRTKRQLLILCYCTCPNAEREREVRSTESSCVGAAAPTRMQTVFGQGQPPYTPYFSSVDMFLYDLICRKKKKLWIAGPTRQPVELQCLCLLQGMGPSSSTTSPTKSLTVGAAGNARGKYQGPTGQRAVYARTVLLKISATRGKAVHFVRLLQPKQQIHPSRWIRQGRLPLRPSLASSLCRTR